MICKKTKFSPKIKLFDDIWQNICSYLTSYTWVNLLKTGDREIYTLLISPRILEQITWIIDMSKKYLNIEGIKGIKTHIKKIHIIGSGGNDYCRENIFNRYMLLNELNQITHLFMESTFLNIPTLKKLTHLEAKYSCVTLSSHKKEHNSLFPLLKYMKIDTETILQSPKSVLDFYTQTVYFLILNQKIKLQ